MKQLLIISGKGGTGKTSLSASFAALAGRSVIADCDVDAADLHLLLAPEPAVPHPFSALPGVAIDAARCLACGACQTVCRFDAIVAGDDGVRDVAPFACEGCRRCIDACPESAIGLQPRMAGHWSVAETRFGPLVHARLIPGEENSGKLVAQVRQSAERTAAEGGQQLVIIDGPPGIGCPVISALSGVDLALVVTEPTASALSDLRRVVATAWHFCVPVLVVINKCDLAAAGTAAIEDYCLEEGLPLAGKIPFDPEIVTSIADGRPPVPGSSCGALAIEAIWNTVAAALLTGTEGEAP